MIFMFFYLLNQDLLLVGIYSIYFQLGLKFQDICEGLKNFKGSILYPFSKLYYSSQTPEEQPNN